MSPLICQNLGVPWHTRHTQGRHPWNGAKNKNFWYFSIFKEHVEAELNNLKSKIESIEGDPECAKKILKIYNIYSSNSFMSGVRIKTSRFNHSCQPNATTGKMILKPILVRIHIWLQVFWSKFKFNIICNFLNFKTQENIGRQ